MPSATELTDRTNEDAATRIARRIDRDLRLRTQRRRSTLIAVSLGALLLVGGLSVAMARGGLFAGSDSGARQPVARAINPSESVEPSTTSKFSAATDATQTSSVPAAVPSEPPATAPEPPVAKAPVKVAPPPPKKAPTATSSGAAILVEKCAGSQCHSKSEVSGGGLDRESAEGAVQGMTDGGYVKLTSSEYEAVITALTRK